MPNSTHRIVFFDGVCGLCNRLVDFLIPRDPTGIFRFAPLQGKTAGERLEAADVESLKTIVLLHKQATYRRSAAVVQILWQVGGVWKLLAGMLWLVPRPIRDLGYEVVAANRYRLFGRKETCRMPTLQERERLLP